MKTLEQIVDMLWRPTYIKPNFNEIDLMSHKEDVKSKNKAALRFTTMITINNRYDYSKLIMQPFYGKAIGEPIVKICNRILTCPNRFIVVKEGVVKEYFKYSSPVVVRGVTVLQDKDVSSGKFVFGGDKTIFPTFLTPDESKLLYAVAQEWYKTQKDEIDRKKQLREQEKRDKFRQELMNYYKEIKS
jgi:hypothetical protein